MHFYETFLIETTEGMQFKAVANSHPEGHIIARPKYIPCDLLNLDGYKKRFIFQKCMTRFHFFGPTGAVKKSIDLFKKRFPEYIYKSNLHKNLFFAVPKNKIKNIPDPREGLKQLLLIPKENLDDYLISVVELAKLLTKSGVSSKHLGIISSTLFGNYTPRKSDIDIIIFGKENGWKILRFLETANHPSLKWKTKDDWAKYYKERVVSDNFSEEEYVHMMIRKKDDGFFNGHVFSLFVVEEPEELWENWEDAHEPIGTATVKGTVTDDYNSIVRPGCYEINNSVVEEFEDINVKRIVTLSRPFVLQARKGETIKARGLLEKVTPSAGTPYYQLVIGYTDAYLTGREKEEYIKTELA